jgi:hypothetical protein
MEKAVQFSSWPRVTTVAAQEQSTGFHRFFKANGWYRDFGSADVSFQAVFPESGSWSGSPDELSSRPSCVHSMLI